MTRQAGSAHRVPTPGTGLRRRLAILALLVAGFPCLGLPATAGQGSGPVPGSAGDSTTRLTIETTAGTGHAFTIELAADADARRTGLMYRQSLPADAGMLFDYGRLSPVAMWMKNTFIPLDMLFMDDTGRIVFIAERTVPHSLEPVGPTDRVRAVLEVNSGTVHRLGIRVGDRVRHAIFSAAPTP